MIISGKIFVNNLNNNPISLNGAKIILENSNTSASLKTKSALDGTFSFETDNIGGGFTRIEDHNFIISWGTFKMIKKVAAGSNNEIELISDRGKGIPWSAHEIGDGIVNILRKYLEDPKKRTIMKYSINNKLKQNTNIHEVLDSGISFISIVKFHFLNNVFLRDENIDYITEFEKSKTRLLFLKDGRIMESGLFDVKFDVKYGVGTFIYPDWKREDIKLHSYPRVSVQLASATSRPSGAGGTGNLSSLMFKVTVFSGARSNDEVLELSERIRRIININSKKIPGAKYIYSSDFGDVEKESERGERVVSLSQLFTIPSKEEGHP